MKNASILLGVICSLCGSNLLGFGSPDLAKRAADAAGKIEPMLVQAVGDVAEKHGYQKLGSNVVAVTQFVDADQQPLTNGIFKIQTFQILTTLQGAPQAEPVAPPVPEIPAPVPPEGGTTNAAPAAPAPMLRSVGWDKFPRIKFDAPEIESWPKEGPKNIVGVLCINGEKVEHVAAGRQWSTVVNATVQGGKYFKNIAHGQTVEISIRSNDGKKETNRLPIVWP